MEETRDSNASPPATALVDLASQEEAGTRRMRMRSLWIAQLALCVFSLGFSIVLTGVYPYMKQVRQSFQQG